MRKNHCFKAEEDLASQINKDNRRTNEHGKVQQTEK